MTTFEYDDQGRVSASVTIREPEFSAMDVAALLEARRRQRVKRGPHGYPITEAMDPANQFAFKADKPVRDWAMAELHRAQKAWFAANPDDKHDPSLVFPVQKLG